MASSASPANDNPSRALFDSQPSDRELVQSYLRRWVKSGINAGTAFIHETDVYADEPANLTTQFAPAVSGDGERAWYFLTPLHSKSKVRGKRKKRTVANDEGWWHSEAKPKPVVDTLDARRQVGYRQSFTFMKDVGGKRTRTGWLMLELGLGSKQDQKEAPAGSFVLCKVYRSPRFPGERAAKASTRAGRKRKADHVESSAPPRPQWKTDGDEGSDASRATAGRRKSDGEGSSAATVAAPSKADDKITVTATAAAPGRKEKDADDEDSDETSEAAPPGSKRKAADDDSSVAASAVEPSRRKRKIDGGPELNCPQCGCHLDAEAVLAAAKSKEDSKSKTAIVQVEGGSFVDHSFYQFI